MGMPDLASESVNLKFTLGKADIVRDGENIVVADEYDIGEIGGIGEQGQLEKLKFLTDSVMSYFQNYVSEYGLDHKVAEAYGANPGHGPSIRAAIGTAEDLGISEQQFNRLPTLADYNKKNAGRIKQRPIRKFLQDIGVPLRNV